jgi:alpha-L-rhamnosidase
MNQQDTLADIINGDTYPGYGWFLKQGYTTWPENWQGQGSLMHGCYNGIGLWFNQGLGGVQASFANPGYQLFTIQPPMQLSTTQATWVNSSTSTTHGLIESHWQRDSDKFQHVVVVPPNTQATITWQAQVANATESGSPIAEASGVHVVSSTATSTIVRVGSGLFVFKFQLN